jgi:hypothetical protein
MRTFPSEFSDLLTKRGKKVAAGRTPATPPPPGETFFVLHDGLVDHGVATECVRLLDRHLHPLLQPIVGKIPPDSISSMTVNYGETLPKTVRMKSCHLHDKRCRAYPVAEKINLLPLLRSQSLHRFAETVTGLSLTPDAYQVICYEQGDYAGPHNDHHPENEDLRDGFVDLHIMFSNDAVDHHWIVYERNGHLNQILDINLEGGIAVYRLPFWHYTTPLAAKPGREKEARRWLLLVSFYIVQGQTKARHKA